MLKLRLRFTKQEERRNKTMFKDCNCPACGHLFEIRTVEAKQYDGCPVDKKITALCPHCRKIVLFKK